MDKIRKTSSGCSLSLPKELINTMLAYAGAKAAYKATEQNIRNLPEDAQPSLLEVIALNDTSHLGLPAKVTNESYENPERLKGMYKDSAAVLSKATALGNKALREYHIQTKAVLDKSGIDGLTGLLRKEKDFGAFMDIYARESLKVARTGKERWIGLLHLDLDNFQAGNSAYGHAEMDNVLSKTGAIIKKVLKKDLEYAVRTGGEEFVAYTVSSVRNGPQIVAEKLRNDIAKARHYLKRGKKKELYRQTASIGYDVLKLDIESAKEVKSIYNLSGKKLKSATSKRRDLFNARTEKISKIVKPIFEGRYANADNATYDAKVLGKDEIMKFNPKKEIMGFYSYIRDLYQRIKDGEVTPANAKRLADAYFVRVYL